MGETFFSSGEDISPPLSRTSGDLLIGSRGWPMSLGNRSIGAAEGKCHASHSGVECCNTARWMYMGV
jgi:hypothetical protein